MVGKKLIALKLISVTQLDEALAEQKKSGLKLGAILVKKGFATRQQIENTLDNYYLLLI